MKQREIEKVIAREVLDSRGNPTVEAVVFCKNGITGTGIAPSGASTGEFEALELRDGDRARYMGKGVKKAVSNVKEVINDILKGNDVTRIQQLDKIMTAVDHTKDKSKLGANAILATSIACVKAGAKQMQVPLYAYLGGSVGVTMPVPMMNIINGGAHSKNSIDFQEFMIVPVGACCFREALRMGTEVYHSLQTVLEKKSLSTAVGDEGGFAPNLSSVTEVMDILVEAVREAGYISGQDICYALDVAASEWKSSQGKGWYELPKSGLQLSSRELIEQYKELIEKYPILSIEDPLDEEDFEGWKDITAQLGNRVQLVGDDLFVTNVERLQMGILENIGNAILIKLNQIGTVTETIEAIQMAHRAGYKAIVSHRSGETEDTTIADLAVAMNTGQIKTGAPCRGERTAKYNRLLRIEEELGEAAFYPGKRAFA